MEGIDPEKVIGDTSKPDDQAPASEPAQTPAKITPGKAIVAIFNGMGIGLLLGMLLGLSISPVVSGVIATLSSLLAIMLGLSEKLLDPMKSLRIGAFGLFAVVGILGGLYMRANDPFAPTLLDKKNEYIALGYDDKEARDFITGIVKADTGKARREANVLYSSSVKLGDCTKLNRMEVNDELSEIVRTFNRAGGTWEEFAEVFQNELKDEALVKKSLITLRDCFCGNSSGGEIKMTNLEEVKKLSGNDPLEHIEEVLSSAASGENWQTIVAKFRENIPEKDRKQVYLSAIKVLTHD